MSLEEAMDAARQLALLTEDAAGLESIDPEVIEQVLSRREALIWRLSACCRPEILASAAEGERRALATLLRTADAATKAMLDAGMRARDMARDQLMAAGPMMRQHRASIEPRFTERVA